MKTDLLKQRNNPIATGGAASLVRARRSLIAVGQIRRNLGICIPYANYGLKKLGTFGVLGIALIAFSAAMYFGSVLPLRGQLDTQIAATELAGVPDAASLQASGAPATSPELSFIESLPDRDEVPGVLAQVLAAAAASGIELERGDYTFVEGSGSGAIDRYQFTFPVRGGYLQIRDFIDRALVAVPSLALQGMSVGRDEVAAGRVESELSFALLVRGQP